MLWNKKVEEEDKLPELPFQSRQINNDQNSQVVENESQDEHFESIKTSEKQSLPSFPDSPINKGFSQSAIKEAVSSGENEKIPLPPQAEDEVDFLANDLKSQSKTSFPSDSSKNVFIQPNPFLNESIVTQKKAEPPAVARMKVESKPIKMVSLPHDYPDDAPHPPVKVQAPEPTKRVEIPVIPKAQPLPQIKRIAPQSPPRDEFADDFPRSEEKTTDVFVKIDKFYAAKKSLTAIKQDVKEIENLLVRIRETKMKEERELADWEKNIISVKSEISNINDQLFDKSL